MLSVLSHSSLPLSLLLFTFVAVAADLLEDYRTCKKQNFVNQTLVCDVDNLLSDQTTANLEQVLSNIQTRLKCQCVDPTLCFQNADSDEQKAYTAVLIATTSDKTTGLDMNATARSIYYDAQLGRAGCDNGMIVIYVQDKHEINTYRGALTYGMLTDHDMQELHTRALEENKKGDGAGLEYLFRGYEMEMTKRKVQIASWEPVLGLIVATAISLLVLALLTAILCVCCCAGKEPKRQNLNGVETYRPAAEPIYIVSEPGSELNSNGQEVIYTTPFGNGTTGPGRAEKQQYDSLEFLDPKRQIEVQTKRDYIF